MTADLESSQGAKNVMTYIIDSVEKPILLSNLFIPAESVICETQFLSSL